MATNKEIIDISVRGAGRTQKALKGIGSSVLKVGAAFFAAKGLVRGMQTIVQDSAKLQGVERAFNSMGKQIGFTENSFKKFLDEIVDKNGHLPYCNEDKHNLIDYSGQGYASSYRCQELEGEVAFTNILLKYGYEISLFNTKKYSNGDKIVIGDCPDIGVGLLGRKVSINGHEDEATGIVDRTNVIDSKPVVRINSKYYSMQDVIFL